MVLPLCITDGKSEASLELRHLTENGRSLSGQALLGPESATRVGGSGRARGSGESTLKKKEEKEKKKEKKNSEKQQGAVPAWASLTAFLPGPSPRAATMAKY